MRIALIYDRIYPHTIGGGEKVLHGVAQHLSQRHEVHRFGMKFWDGPAVQEVAPNIFHHGVCPAVAMYKDTGGKQRSMKQAFLFARRVPWALMRAGYFDLIDCMATPYLHLYPTTLVAKLKGIPLVSSWLEIWRDDHWNEYLDNRFLAKIASTIERNAVRLPRHIIAISEHTAEGLRDCGVSDDKLTIIPPWIDCDEIAQHAPELEEQCDILFVGRLIPSKGVDLLIRSLRRLKERLPGLRCRIVGEGSEEEHLKGLAQELGLSDNVEFSGFVESVFPVMKSARMLALLSDREGFGMVVIEAGACGLPTVTLDVPNNAARLLVRESGHGAVCEGDPEAVADALHTCLSASEEESGTRAEALRQWARQYDRQHAMSAYEEIYLDTVNRARRNGGSTT